MPRTAAPSEPAAQRRPAPPASRPAPIPAAPAAAPAPAFADTGGGAGYVAAPDQAFADEAEAAAPAFERPQSAIPAAPIVRDAADGVTVAEEAAGYIGGESALNFRGLITHDHLDILAALYAAHMQHRPNSRPVTVAAVDVNWQRLHNAEFDRPILHHLTELVDSSMVQQVGDRVRFPDLLVRWMLEPRNRIHARRFRASVVKLGVAAPAWLASVRD